MSADPFLAVQGEVTQQLKEVERMQASYLRAAGSSREAAGAALGALQCASTCSSRRDWLLRVERRAETRERDVYVYV